MPACRLNANSGRGCHIKQVLFEPMANNIVIFLSQQKSDNISGSEYVKKIFLSLVFTISEMNLCKHYVV